MSAGCEPAPPAAPAGTIRTVSKSHLSMRWKCRWLPSLDALGGGWRWLCSDDPMRWVRWVYVQLLLLSCVTETGLLNAQDNMRQMESLMLSALQTEHFEDSLRACKLLQSQLSVNSNMRYILEEVVDSWILKNTINEDPFMTRAITYFVHAAASVRGEICNFNVASLLRSARKTGQAVAADEVLIAEMICTWVGFESSMLSTMMESEKNMRQMVRYMSDNSELKEAIKSIVDNWIEKQLWIQIPAIKFALHFFRDALACVNREMNCSEREHNIDCAFAFEHTIDAYKKGFLENVNVNDAKRGGLTVDLMLNSEAPNEELFQWGDTEKLTRATYGEIGVEEQMILVFMKDGYKDYIAACHVMQKILTDTDFLTVVEKVCFRWVDEGVAEYACDVFGLMIKFARGPMSKSSSDAYQANCSFSGVVGPDDVMIEYDMNGGFETLNEFTTTSLEEVALDEATVSEKMFCSEEEAMRVQIAAKNSGEILSTYASDGKAVLLKVKNLKKSEHPYCGQALTFEEKLAWGEWRLKKAREKEMEQKEMGGQKEVGKQTSFRFPTSSCKQKEVGKQKEVKKQQGCAQKEVGKQKEVEKQQGCAHFLFKQKEVGKQQGSGTRSRSRKKVNPEPCTCNPKHSTLCLENTRYTLNPKP